MSQTSISYAEVPHIPKFDFATLSMSGNFIFVKSGGFPMNISL